MFSPTPTSTPPRLRTRAERRLAWLRDAAAAGTLTLAMLQGAPEAVAQIAPDPAGPEFQVNTFTTGTQRFPAAAMDADGDFVVAWTGFGQDDPSASSRGGIFAQRYNAAGVAQGGEFQVNTFTTGDQGRASVAMDDAGAFVVVWTSLGQDAPNTSGIFAQRYNAAGVAQGSEFQVNTFTRGSQRAPAVAMDADGDFVVAWQSYGQDDSSSPYDYGIFAQRYNAAGTPQGAEFRVNTFVTGDQQDPAVAMDGAGNFVVAWESEGQDDLIASFKYGVYAQRYAADGAPQGAEFRVNAVTIGSQLNPSVGMSGDGRFAIAWQSEGQDDPAALSDEGVYARRYASDGTAQGGEFQVNTFTTNDQIVPSVGMDADGDFVVAWSSAGQDDPSASAFTGVFGQRYAADGTPQGSEFQVNTFTTGFQQPPSVGVDADGDFVVAWQGLGQDDPSASFDSGIFAQRYATTVPTVFDFDAQTLADNGTVDRTRLTSWPDASPNMLDAVGSTPNTRPLFRSSIAALGDQPAVFFDGINDRLAIGKDDALFGTNQPEKSLAFVFRTGADVVTRQVLVELGGEEAGLNVYLDDGQLYVGGWSQSGLPGDWGPAFFSTPAAAQTAYAVVVSHRRDAAGAPGRFEAYVNGTRIGLLRPAVNAFAPVRDNAGIGRITATTRYHDRVSTAGERAHARMFVGKLEQRNEFLDPAAVATLTSDLATRFGLTLADQAPVASSVAVPSGIELDAYPNPTSGAATVQFELEQASDVRVAVYDALGREVAVLAEGVREAGWHSAVLSGADLASGVYVVRVEAGADVVTRRVTVLR